MPARKLNFGYHNKPGALNHFISSRKRIETLLKCQNLTVNERSFEKGVFSLRSRSSPMRCNNKAGKVLLSIHCDELISLSLRMTNHYLLASIWNFSRRNVILTLEIIVVRLREVCLVYLGGSARKAEAG